MSRQFSIASYDVPVMYTPDVCVIGAGAAGIAAAVAAARTGLSVLIVEKYGFSGGATVAGLSGTICGLFSSGNNPQQIVYGFANEFYHALQQRDAVTAPIAFGNTFLVPHDCTKWKEIADNMLVANNCKILYHTYFLKAFLDDRGRIEAILLRGQGGQLVIKPSIVIDASGDAEVVHSISGPNFLGNNGVVQTPTMMFKMSNVDVAAFMQMGSEALIAKVTEADRSGKYRLPRHHVYVFPLPNSGEVLCNMTKITYPDGKVPLGISSEDMSFAEIEGRKQAREYVNFLVNEVAAFRHAYMSATGAQVGIRQTRSIEGKEKLRNEDVVNALKSKNAITYSAWPIELHSNGELKIVQLNNDHYDIAFETLIPQNATNYLVAGRCMSAEHEALASARVTAQCFGMGYAAGAAAGLIIHSNINAHDLSGVMVKQWMTQHKLKHTDEK